MRWFLVLLGALCLLAGCRPSENSAASSSTTTTSTAAPDGVQIRIEADGALALGEVPLVVYLLEDGAGVSGATVELTGDMTHAGMVPVIAEATEAEPGLYRAETFEFTMAGDWIITADVELPGGERETAELPVSVPSP